MFTADRRAGSRRAAASALARHPLRPARQRRRLEELRAAAWRYLDARAEAAARGLEEVARWVLSYGDNVKAVSPPELVERVRTSLRDAAARYEA